MIPSRIGSCELFSFSLSTLAKHQSARVISFSNTSNDSADVLSPHSQTVNQLSTVFNHAANRPSLPPDSALTRSICPVRALRKGASVLCCAKSSRTARFYWNIENAFDNEPIAVALHAVQSATVFIFTAKTLVRASLASWWLRMPGVTFPLLQNSSYARPFFTDDKRCPLSHTLFTHAHTYWHSQWR